MELPLALPSARLQAQPSAWQTVRQPRGSETLPGPGWRRLRTGIRTSRWALPNTPQLCRCAVRLRARLFYGSTPLGFTDYNGDRRTDLAAVIPPHIGGTLTRYHYRSPLLVPFAKVMDVSNHRMGAIE